MGEISDDMIEGRACEICGEYFQNPQHPSEIYEHGYPAVCWDCWNELTPKEKKERNKSEVPTF